LLTGLVSNGRSQNRFIARDSVAAGSGRPESPLTQLRATIGEHRVPPEYASIERLRAAALF